MKRPLSTPFDAGETPAAPATVTSVDPGHGNSGRPEVRPLAGTRCSTWARTVGADPIGSAGSYQAYLLAELPLPWPKDIADLPEVTALRSAVDPRTRIQALVPQGGQRRLVAYLRPSTDPDGFRGFVRREAAVTDDLAGAAARLLDQPAAEEAAADQGRDLLLCTHGRRDVCCGSLGMDLFLQVADAGLPADVHVWRTSHTGGHRFAPTFIVLPEGTVWAYADPDLVRRVLLRDGDVSEVADRYRGCSGLASPRIQAVEREVLRRVGWRLLDLERYGTEHGGTVTFLVRDAEHATTWEASVEPGRVMAVPGCKAGTAGPSKHETEWTVTRLAVVHENPVPRL